MSNENAIISIGIDNFDKPLSDAGAEFVKLDWQPAAQGNSDLLDILFKIETTLIDNEGKSLVDKANAEALSRIKKGNPVLKQVKFAHEVIPNMTKNCIYHAGPPINWKDMCGPMRGAFIGAIKYEGLADTDEEAIALMDNGKITYGPNHHNDCVGPMTGMISYSMPLWEIENTAFGNKAYCTFNEGIGKVMRFGAYDESVITRLKWIEKVLAPAVNKAILSVGGVNLKNIVAQALSMGDEMHQRNVAASLCFFKVICEDLAKAVQDNPEGPEILSFIGQKNEQFFLNLAMAYGKALLDPIRGIPYCTLVSCMSRNGVNFGINVGDLESKWFEAPCENPKAMYFPGYSEEDANPDMGDSAIVECYGIGGFSMCASPAVVSFVGGGSVSDALNFTQKMQLITEGENPNLPIANLDFAGVPTGIDIRKVVASSILPVINTGVAHKKAGVGQVGAGIVSPPMEIMHLALKEFAAKHL